MKSLIGAVNQKKEGWLWKLRNPPFEALITTLSDTYKCRVINGCGLVVANDRGCEIDGMISITRQMRLGPYFTPVTGHIDHDVNDSFLRKVQVSKRVKSFTKSTWVTLTENFSSTLSRISWWKDTKRYNLFYGHFTVLGSCHFICEADSIGRQCIAMLFLYTP